MGSWNSLSDNIAATGYLDTTLPATDIAWVDMKGYSAFMVFLVQHTQTTTAIKILANTASDGTGSEITVATGAAFPNAANEYAFLECSEDDLTSGGVFYRYVSANVTMSGVAARCSLTYIRAGAAVSEAGLTADNV